MNYTSKEVLQFVEENDVKFIRLTFCDIFGMQKNISIMSDELGEAFAHGVYLEASEICGFEQAGETDLLLFPDPSTLKVLPWRPQHGRVARLFCDVKNPDGTDFAGDCRAILKHILDESADMQYQCRIGFNCQFYLFKKDDEGNVTDIPWDNGSYCDISPLDKGENIRRDICLNLEQMEISPETSRHQKGPGQNQVDFVAGDAFSAVDNLITFKSVVKSTSERDGLYASFMPKPIADKSANELHINFALLKDGRNIFDKHYDNGQGQSFLAGILQHLSDIALFTNPLTNSYKKHKKSAAIRFSSDKGDKSSLEIRFADMACSPYLAVALLVKAGLAGIQQKLAPVDYKTAVGEKLPQDLSDAVRCAQESTFLKETLPPQLLESYLRHKTEDLDAYNRAPDKQAFEHDLYFYSV